MFVQIIIMGTGNGSQAQPAELSSMSHGHVVESGCPFPRMGFPDYNSRKLDHEQLWLTCLDSVTHCMLIKDIFGRFRNKRVDDLQPLQKAKCFNKTGL